MKILPSNSLVVVVSPLNALIADQRESCQKLKLKAVEMERELFDNDDTLKELKNAEVLYCSPETLENIRSKKFFLRMDNGLIEIVVERACAAFGCGGTTFEAGVHVPKFWEFLLQ